MSEKENVYLTIKNMLQRFPEFIKKNLDGEWCLLNPSNSQENFLKKWKDNSSLKNAFDEWIKQARIDILVHPEQFTENNQIELRSGILKSFGENAGIGAFNRYGIVMSELKKVNCGLTVILLQLQLIHLIKDMKNIHILVVIIIERKSVIHA